MERDAAALVAFVCQTDAESTFLSREPGEYTTSTTAKIHFIRQVTSRINSLYVVAFDGDDLVGSLDFHGGTRRRTAHAGEFGLVVRRSHWGSGLGGHLLDTLLTWAEAGGRVHKIKLKVQGDNRAAIALYERQGFTREGVLQGELIIAGAPVDLILMARWLI